MKSISETGNLMHAVHSHMTATNKQIVGISIYFEICKRIVELNFDISVYFFSPSTFCSKLGKIIKITQFSNFDF